MLTLGYIVMGLVWISIALGLMLRIDANDPVLLYPTALLWPIALPLLYAGAVLGLIVHSLWRLVRDAWT